MNFEYTMTSLSPSFPECNIRTSIGTGAYARAEDAWEAALVPVPVQKKTIATTSVAPPPIIQPEDLVLPPAPRRIVDLG